jgi:hypothetical protein
MARAKFELAPEREDLDDTHPWASASERFPFDQFLRSQGYTIAHRAKDRQAVWIDQAREEWTEGELRVKFQHLKFFPTP